MKNSYLTNMKAYMEGTTRLFSRYRFRHDFLGGHRSSRITYSQSTHGAFFKMWYAVTWAAKVVADKSCDTLSVR